MSQFKRLQVLNNMIDSGIVPLYYNKDVEICKQVIKACYSGCITLFEFTNRGDFAHEVFAEIMKWSAKECPGMIIGVGSVIDGGTASLYIQMGANFVVAPILNPEVAKVCNRRKIPWIPGCGTLSEINYAEELGAEIVKIFPAAEIGGPAFVRNIKAPCPWTSIMASGGVTPEHDNLKAWFDAGVACVGMGSRLITEILVKEKKFNELTTRVNDTIKIIKQLKNK